MEKIKRTNYILVDFENTQVVDLELITGKHVQVILVIGEKQKHLPLTLVKQLLAHASQVTIIESTCVGRNALDFILAYQIGKLVQQDPMGYFHIVSKDKGFDPLIAHLKRQSVLASRHDDFTKIPILCNQAILQAPVNKAALPVLTQLSITSQLEQPLHDKIKLLIEHLMKRDIARPLTRESLIADIHARFARKLTDLEVVALVKQLEQLKFIKISADNKVGYFMHMVRSSEYFAG
ncbi:MAG TPA: PIN domain-containing protein [Thiolinea sp.]|nr:PIN domain-containing protein [Thiolinea sp.]